MQSNVFEQSHGKIIQARRFFPLKMFQLLTFIINFSLKSGVVPSEWKVAKVIPLYKSGSLAEIDDYRPISFLPTL